MDVHGQDHCARGEVLRKIKKSWWPPFLIGTVDQVLHECNVYAQYNVRKAFSAAIGHIPPPDGPFRHLIIDLKQSKTSPGQEIYAGYSGQIQSLD